MYAPASRVATHPQPAELSFRARLAHRLLEAALTLKHLCRTREFRRPQFAVRLAAAANGVISLAEHALAVDVDTEILVDNLRTYLARCADTVLAAALDDCVHDSAVIEELIGIGSELCSVRGELAALSDVAFIASLSDLKSAVHLRVATAEADEAEADEADEADAA